MKPDKGSEVKKKSRFGIKQKMNLLFGVFLIVIPLMLPLIIPFLGIYLIIDRLIRWREKKWNYKLKKKFINVLINDIKRQEVNSAE